MPMLSICCLQAHKMVRGPGVSAVCAEHDYCVSCFVVLGAGGEGFKMRVIYAVHFVGHYSSQSVRHELLEEGLFDAPTV